MTGTIRGYERDQLVLTNTVFRALLDPAYGIGATVYLVSTSAGEVGIDLDADHMVCDLTTLDSMIQRIGRVNRRGGRGRLALVDVVVQEAARKKSEPTEVDLAIEATKEILKAWSVESEGARDLSPRGLRKLLDGLDEEKRKAAFAPKPAVPPLTDILLDAWSLTSITQQMPGRPEVARYLHGLSNDPPETFVAWRKELRLLRESGAAAETLSDWFLACRIEAREHLRDRTDRVKKKLGDLLKNHRRADENLDFDVVLLSERGEARWSRLSQIVAGEFNLDYRTVVLPIEVGGLNPNDGTLDPGVYAEAIEVAEQAIALKSGGEPRERWLLIKDAEGQRRYQRLITGETALSLPANLRERERVTLREPLEGEEEEGESRYLLLMVEPGGLALEHPETAKVTQPLSSHLGMIGQHASRIADALGLEPSFKEALIKAAVCHDRGKSRPVWQRYACNSDPDAPLAKSIKYLHGRALGGYRHEFGSLLESAAEQEIQKHPESDLILHLIAAHHGWGRPHFQPNAFDLTYTTAANEQAAVEVMQRFGRLQQRFGRWGLMWLESLLRCADIAASKQVAQPADEAPSKEARA